MSSESEDVPSSPDIRFEPVVKLPLVEVKTLEEDEDEILKLRAKLYRFDNSENPPEWKERGTGNVKILKDRKKGTTRIVMRREKTLKICANHYIMPHMDLKPNGESGRVWLWSTPADFADEEMKPELFAIKFQNAECAQKFKATFDAVKTGTKVPLLKDDEESDEITGKLDTMNLKDQENTNEVDDEASSNNKDKGDETNDSKSAKTEKDDESAK